MGEDFPAAWGCDVARHGGFGRCHESAADIKHARPAGTRIPKCGRLKAALKMARQPLNYPGVCPGF